MRARLFALLLAAMAGDAIAQPPARDEAAADIIARAALPRATIRTIRPEVRTIMGLNGGLDGASRAISGAVVAIAAVQRSLDQEGLSTRLVNGALEISLPGDVLFDFNKATIRTTAIPTLEKIKIAADRTRPRPVRTEGHTDAIGVPEYNQRLSEARAGAVANWLVNAGIDRARVTSAGFGATRPIAANKRPDGGDDPAGRQKNRRVTIIL